MKSFAPVAFLWLAGLAAATGVVSDASSIPDGGIPPTPTLKGRALSDTGTEFFTGPPAIATGTNLFTGPPAIATGTNFLTGPPAATGTGFLTTPTFVAGTGFGTSRFTTGFATSTRSRFPGATITHFSNGANSDTTASAATALAIRVGIALACYLLLGVIVLIVFLRRQKSRKAWYGPMAKYYRDGGHKVEIGQPLPNPHVYGQQRAESNPFATHSSSTIPAPPSQYDTNVNYYGQGGQDYGQQQHYGAHPTQRGTYQTGHQTQVMPV